LKIGQHLIYIHVPIYIHFYDSTSFPYPT